MTEEVEVNEPVVAAARRCQVLCVPVLPETVGSPGANHEKCSQRYVVISTSNKDMSRKQGKVQEASTTLSPHKLEEVLPVMKVKINGMDWIALVDSGCSSSIVSGMLCRPEVWKSMTPGKQCLLSHGVGSVTLTVTNRNPLKPNVLVVNSKQLEFDLLQGMDIKKLDGVYINK